MFDVVCVGGVTQDLFLNTKSELISLRTPSSNEELIAYPVGAKILVKDVIKSFGGGAFNSSVSLSRLGLKVGIVSCVGEDNLGKEILKRMKSEKIKFLGCKSKTKTGFSIILDSIDEDRTILSYRGSNEMLSFNSVKKDKLKTKWFYLSSVSGKALGAEELIVKLAVKKKIKLFMNPSTYMAKLGFERLRNIISHLNILDLNKEEAEYITGIKGIADNLKWLKNLVKEVVVITDGKNGAYAYDGSFFYRIRGRKTKVVETTGAGDAFASTFLYSYIKNKDISESLKLAMANAVSVVSNYGAQNGLLSSMDLKKKSQKLRARVVKSRKFSHAPKRI